MSGQATKAPGADERLAIPLGALGSHLAILGKTGSGKTYAAKGLAESILKAKGRICILDPTGAWHGLRSSATGKSAGFPVTIFGGRHGDLPLGAAHGEAIAEIVGTSDTPAILDTSQLKVSERTQFFTDFADALMRKNRGPLHLVIDEAHVFAPQGKVPNPKSGEMLAAANNLVSGGRSRGLRVMLITQRPAKLHKDSLTQVETLVALRLIAPQDRRAVEDWIADNADEKQGREVLTSLATLKTGQAWVWAPELGVLERVTFPRIRTFDSSKAPEDDVDGAGPVFAKIDRDAIADRLKAAGADALAADPGTLRKRIAELERQLKAKPAGPSEDSLAEAERRGAAKGVAAAQAAVAELIGQHAHEVWSLLNSLAAATTSKAPAGDGRTQERVARAAAAPARVRPPAPRPQSSGDLPKGQAATLRACIQYPDGLERRQLTVLTGYKRSSRDAYIYRLRESGLVECAGERVTATEAGRAALPDAEPLPTGVELQEFWLQRLPKGEREILELLIAAHPEAIARRDLDERTGFARSSRDAYLYRLRKKELVFEQSDGAVRASDSLFEEVGSAAG